MQKKNKQVIFGVVGVVLVVLVFVLIGILVSTRRQLTAATRDVESQVNLAVATAREEQRLIDEERFQAEQLATTYAFRGPDDYGALSFSYPKAWALYVQQAANTSGSEYSAVFYPRMITSGQNVYALRVRIQNRSYEEVLRNFNSQVSSGKLTSSVFENDLGAVGTRYDGEVANNQAGGAVVVIKIRDKTATIQTDNEVFKGSFNDLLPTIVYND